MNVHPAIVDPLKDSRWDVFVEQHAFGWICHLSGWKHVLETSFKHMHGYYLALIQDQTIRAALPVYEVRSRLIGSRLVSVPFATISDPLVSSVEDMTLLLGALSGLSIRTGINLIEIKTLSSPPYIQDGRLERMDHYKHHYIVLDRPMDVIRKTFHRSCVRQRIARALKSGIEIAYGDTDYDLQQFYNLYLSSRKRLCLPPQPRLFFKSLWDTFHPSKKTTLLMARKEELLIGCLMLFKFRDRVSAEFAVCDAGYLAISPLHQLFWEAIQTAQREGYRIFDFGRTSLEDQKLMDFKKRWGTEITDLPQFYYTLDPAGRRLPTGNSLKRKIVRQICKSSPKALYVALGNLLYRHMG